LSSLVRHWGWLLLLGIGLLVMGIRRTLKRPGPRHTFDRWLLRAPLLGKLARGYNTVRFSSTLAILSAADVPILMALQAAGETLGNSVMRTQVEQAIVRVREGAALSSALAGTHEFPPVLTHLIRSGEATGNVSIMLERAAQGEAAELERRTLFFAGMLEPLLILAMGAIVLGIVLAVMLPIIDLNNLVK
jgi:general secretion pathway protein F